MPNPVDDLSDEQLEALPEGLRGEVRKNQEYRKENEALSSRAAAAEREAAFARAGVPDTPLVAQLAKTYEGENDPAAVRAYFEGLGVDLSGSGTGQDGPSDEELAAQRQVAQVGGEGGVGGEVRFEDAMRSTKNPEELMALIASAPEGATTRAIDGVPRRIGVPTIE